MARNWKVASSTPGWESTRPIIPLGAIKNEYQFVRKSTVVVQWYIRPRYRNVEFTNTGPGFQTGDERCLKCLFEREITDLSCGRGGGGGIFDNRNSHGIILTSAKCLLGQNAPEHHDSLIGSDLVT